MPIFNFKMDCCFPGRGKIRNIYRINVEQLVLSPQTSYIVLQWMALIAAKLCKFTARGSGEPRKIQHISSLTTDYRPYLGSNLSPTACHILLLPLRQHSIRFRIIALNLNQLHSTFFKTCVLNFCKICIFSGEITYFSGEMWWCFCKFTTSGILGVKLHKVTAKKKVSKRCKIKG